VTLFNCFVVGDIGDDLGSIFDHLREAALTMQQGGGIGYDFSSLRPIDGGKKIRGVKINVAVDKYGIPLAIDVSPAHRHDTKAIVPVLRTLAEGFEGAALGDLGYRGERLANVGETLGMASRRLRAAVTDGSSRPSSAG
jgi:hypothetical protein